MLPIISPGVAAGAVFAFAASFDEVVMVLFIAGPDQRTLPKQMFTGLREQLDPTIIAAASLMLLVVRFPDPVTLLDAGADAVRPLLLAGAMFAYFFGTVLYVKTNIRERGSRPFLIASIGWHAGATVAASALASAGPLPWWWAGFFLITTVRAADVPRRVWTPRRIGFLEACLCVVMLIGHLVSRPG